MTLSTTPDQAAAAAQLELAKVTYVNMREYTVDVMTVYTHRPLVGIPFATPFASQYHAGGINVMPEVDTHCYVATCGSNTSFVVGFITNPTASAPTADDELGLGPLAASNGGVSFAGNRPPLEPGDVYLATRDRNFMILRRGGLLEIGATNLAQRVYIPIQNTVRDYFQRYEAYSPLGEISWGHPTLMVGENVTGDTDTTPVLVKYSIKDIAQEDVTAGKYTVECRLGRVTKDTLDLESDSEHVFANKNLRENSHTIPEDGASGVLSLTIYSHTTNRVTYAFQLDKEGNNFVTTAGSMHIEVDDSLYARVKGDTKIEFGDPASLLELTSNGVLKAEIRSMVVDALKEILLKSKVISLDNGGGVTTIENSALLNIRAGNIILGGSGVGVGGGGPSFPVVKDNGLLGSLASHKHVVELLVPQPLCAAIVANAVVGSPGVVLVGTSSVSPNLATATTAAAKGTKTT